MHQKKQRLLFVFVTIGLLLLASPTLAHDLTVQFGWGAGREIAYRSAISVHPLLEGEVFALLKDASPGQHVRPA